MDEFHLTSSVRRALSLARDEALRLQHDLVEIEHLIFGLMYAESETGEHVMKDRGFTLDQVHQLLKSMPGQRPVSPEKLSFSPKVIRLLKLAIDESQRHGHTSVGIETMLFVLAGDLDSIKFFKQLGLSPEKIRNQMHFSLKELPMSSVEADPPAANDYLFLREEFQTPHHTTDIKKLLVKCRYPIYTLVSKHQSFQLCQVNFGLSQSIYLTHISFEFSHPHCHINPGDLRLMQRVRVDNWGQTGSGNMRLWQTMAGLDATTIGVDLLRLPPALEGLVGQPDSFTQSEITRWNDLLATDSWGSYVGSGLQFKIAHWNGGETSIGWAYSDQEDPLIVIAALGVSRPDFIGVLDSLIILRPDDESLIEKFQNELKSAKE